MKKRFGEFVQSANSLNLFHGYSLALPGDRKGRPYSLIPICNRPLCWTDHGENFPSAVPTRVSGPKPAR